MSAVFAMTGAISCALIAATRARTDAELRRLDGLVPAGRTPAVTRVSTSSSPVQRFGLNDAEVRLAQRVAGLTALAATVSAIVLGSVVWLVAGVCGAPVASLVTVGRSRRMVRARVAADLPHVLDDIARSLRTGASLTQAVAEVAANGNGTVAAVFARIEHRVAQGQRLGPAIERSCAELVGAAANDAMRALSLAADSGGGAAHAIEGVADSLRDMSEVRSEISALVSQARTSGIAMSLLPVGFVSVGALIDPSSVMFFVEQPVGRVCLVAGLGLDAVGFLWMRWLVSRVAP